MRRPEGRSPWTGRIKSALGHFLIAAMMVLGVSSVRAQEPPTPAKETEQMKAVPDMDHSQMDHSKMDHGAAPPPDPATLSDPGADSGMNHGSMQGGSAPPDARDPHAYSGGYTLDPARPLRMADEHNFHSLLVDRFERVRTRDNSSTEYDLQAWFGRNYDRVVLKAEGEADDGRIEDAHTELLWGHAVAAYWDTQVGVRYDSGKNPDRKWLAFGIQGLAPYWFEVDATAYVGESGRTALRLEAEYELLLTQKLVLQPRIEANFYGKRDAQRELGSGLSDLVLGLRLRYEIRREFAPYIGIERSGEFGGTADFARADGERTKETRFVAGLRFWF
ncbi:copper resistance protein CopB [Sulfuricaulis limicola]|uniref:Copper resistance protein CopB n=2 Tax=Sulfuricaulis limicola TaxID=1620215 RepID=A0A1B4XEP9_9GAMM|nr:copper resistance protein CopB [Sulfuricaulis limicola]